ncbi:MAG: GNAT family N-acetyltransferase [Arenicellales bacterium]|jgi:predicted N-acyltransferase
MLVKIYQSLLDIPAKQWDRVNIDDNPFTSYAFLSSLEESASIGNKTGWLPRYLVMHDESGNLAGALPMYEKHHSWGEYVFDWAWANAWQQCGLAYYPKLIVAVPFSPVSGQRILIADGYEKEQVINGLHQAAIDFAKEASYSSLHYLFPTSDECSYLQQQGLQIRHDVQFHWDNRDYQGFQEFLSTMSSRKRKKIARERRRVSEHGIEFNVISGQEISAVNMQNMYEFYLSTIMAHGSHAYLSSRFFQLLGQRMADNIVLIEAHYQGDIIAAALNIRHEDVLYGRYWGCNEEYHSLHFETCYYQAIDYCINNSLSRFEGGAQGEHKLSRGFLPSITCSAHWMADEKLSSAISDFLDREKAHVAHYQQLLDQRSPFKDDNENG